MLDDRMIEFGQRIKNRRVELGYTQSELAKIAGYSSDSMITKIEKGETDPPRSKIVALANALLVEPSYLMGWTDNKGKLDIAKVPGVITLHKAQRIPILGAIACGKPVWAEENYEGYYVIDSRIEADFCLIAKGDSMIDEGINDGDVAFFKKASIVDNGKIVAVLIDDEATLKRFYKTESGIVLQPANDLYDPIIITRDDGKNILILGELVGSYHKA